MLYVLFRPPEPTKTVVGRNTEPERLGGLGGLGDGPLLLDEEPPKLPPKEAPPRELLEEERLLENPRLPPRLNPPPPLLPPPLPISFPPVICLSIPKGLRHPFCPASDSL